MVYTSQKNIEKAWSYLVIAPATNLAIRLEDVKAFLRIEGTDDDVALIGFIKAATATGEKLTKRDFINKTYRTYRDNFSDFELFYSSAYPIELRRSKLQSVESIKYYKDSVLTTVDTAIYYNTVQSDFSSVLPVDGSTWPSDYDFRLQCIEIEFIAGYGANYLSVPPDIRQALMSHVSNLYSNRGDCPDGIPLGIPTIAKNIYLNNRILDFIL